MKATLLVSFVVLFLIASAATRSQAERVCGCNQIFVTCQPCDQICGQPERACAAVCIEGEYCACKGDYWRTSTGECVEKENCPKPKC